MITSPVSLPVAAAKLGESLDEVRGFLRRNRDFDVSLPRVAGRRVLSADDVERLRAALKESRTARRAAK
jgi:hypothetical protein